MQDQTKYLVQNRNEKELKEYIMMLWYKKWLIIGLLVFAIIASFFITQQMQKIYQSSTLVMLQTESSADSLFSEQLSFIGRNDKLINTYSKIFSSRRVLENVIQELELKNEEGEYISAAGLRQNISIQSGEQSDLITIQLNYPEPELAQKIADSIVYNMQATIRDLNQTSLRSAGDFIDSQLKNTKTKLLKLEDQLLAYREKNEIIMPTTQGKNLLNRYADLESKKIEASLLAEEADVALNEINQKLKGIDEKIISSQSISRNPQISNIESQLTNLYTKLEGLRTKYTPKHPEVQDVQARINNLEKELNNKTAKIISGRTETNNPLYQNLNTQIIEKEVQQLTAAAKEKAYQKQLQKLDKELAVFPQKELSYLRLQREKEVTEEIYLLLRNRKEEINIQQAMQTSDIFVIDNANLPEKPIKPNLLLNLAVAALLALMLAVGIIFLIDYLDNTIKNENDLENISEIPVIGIVPNFDEIDHRKNYGEDN